MDKLFTKHSLILASQSPRRQLLLREVGLDFRIITSNIEETYPDGLTIQEIPVYIAKQKALAVAQMLDNQDLTNELIIAADTIVALEEGQKLFGKPKDRQDAFESIRLLSGKRHEAITGYCLWSADKQVAHAVSTAVYFKELTDEQIFYYIDHYKPYDKAGSYAIQEWIGMVGVQKIEGCYFNVIGLPVSHLLTELLKF